ncbi:prolipoprotein diacylglyceryl transferase [Odoribacter sp. OttesenSCG-928-L07]|nr:prolipoprotein diacylglyceryl transferase [Odoribacter sp. OttesenSCG-928-L07]
MILNYIRWNFNPQVFPNTNIHIAWYGVLFALGIYLCYLILGYAFKREGIGEKVLDKTSLWLLLALVVGARLGHCIFYEPAYYFSNPIRILKVWEGGLASHGAAIALPFTVWLLARKYKFDPIWYLDRLVIGVAIAGALIRLGNFCNSEIYGIETTLPWGVIFERNGETVPKHPTQLYEALSCIITFLILFFIYKKKGKDTPNGLLFGLFLVLIFTFRFFVEYIKNPQVPFEMGMKLYMGQILSIPFILIGIFFLIRSYVKSTIKK